MRCGFRFSLRRCALAGAFRRGGLRVPEKQEVRSKCVVHQGRGQAREHEWHVLRGAAACDGEELTCVDAYHEHGRKGEESTAAAPWRRHGDSDNLCQLLSDEGVRMLSVQQFNLPLPTGCSPCAWVFLRAWICVLRLQLPAPSSDSNRGRSGGAVCRARTRSRSPTKTTYKKASGSAVCKPFLQVKMILCGLHTSS